MAIYKSSRGFTLIELLVVVVIIGILAAVVMANFIGAETKSKLAAVKDNMHTAQLCAESYFTDTGGIYALSGTSLAPYYPTGGSVIGGTAGVYPKNPLTQANGQPLYAESISTAMGVQAVRSTPPTASTGGTQGQVGYNQCDGGTSYAVCGLDQKAFRVAGPNNGTIVMSNQ